MAMVHKYTANENQTLFKMASEVGARTRRTAGVKCGQGFGSGSVLDPDSIGSVDPDPDPYLESGSGSRRA
jgi:hypothetical protein